MLFRSILILSNIFSCLVIISCNTNQITDEEIRQFSADLLNIDNDKAWTTYDVQNKLIPNSNVLAAHPLFQHIPADVWQRQTYKTFIQLLDNYDRNVEMPEKNSNQEKSEVEDFLSEILKTTVMERVREFLIKSGNLTSRDDFKKLLYTLWFENYPRIGNVPGSSGFEHVFVGEIKNNEISGLHSWIQYYLLESTGHATYNGFFSHLTLQRPVVMLKYKFKWDKFSKPTSTMFIGTSPEFEMGMYTVCYFLRSNKQCPIRMGNKSINIQTYAHGYRGRNYIGSAYPNF